MATVHLLIQGKVQGVFYRANAKDKADELGIKGWIKNTDDGDVEAMVSGTEESLHQFIEWCKEGPRRADVANVIRIPQEEASFTDFRIIRR